MDATVIAALIGNIGVPAAAIFAAIGYWYKNRRGRMKSTRKVLYLMLELRHAIMAGVIDPKKASEEYFKQSIAISNKQGFNFDVCQISDGLWSLVTGHIENITTSQQVDVEELLPILDQALLEMAGENPVLAFRLRGKEKLKKLYGHTSDYEVELAENLEQEIEHGLIRSVLLESLEELADEARKEICQMLDDNVLLLAKEVGDYRKCKKVLASGINYNNRYDFKELDQLMEKLLRKLIDALSNRLNSEAL